MKLNPAPDRIDDSMYRRLVSESNLVELAVHPVVFGWRVRAGFTGQPWCALDWCGGADWQAVQLLYSVAAHILSSRPENVGCFDGLPGASTIKPFHRDLNFLIELLHLLRAAGLIGHLPKPRQIDVTPPRPAASDDPFVDPDHEAVVCQLHAYSGLELRDIGDPLPYGWHPRSPTSTHATP